MARFEIRVIAEQAAQCGYCINGMVMQAADLLAQTPRPAEPQIRKALATCAIPAAIGNAVFDATGARLRAVPFTLERVKAALAAGSRPSA